MRPPQNQLCLRAISKQLPLLLFPAMKALITDSASVQLANIWLSLFSRQKSCLQNRLCLCLNQINLKSTNNSNKDRWRVHIDLVFSIAKVWVFWEGLVLQLVTNIAT